MNNKQIVQLSMLSPRDKRKYKHVAPEVVAGTHLPSYASDIYALGLLLEQIANNKQDWLQVASLPQ